MDASWQPYADDAKRTAQVLLHQDATPVELVAGTAAASSPGPIDLSAYASRISQSPDQAQVSLNWHSALSGSAQPAPGNLLEIKLDGDSLWWGVIDTIADYRVERGTRSMTITARSRDASSKWRQVERVTELYPTATPLTFIATDIAHSLGLTDLEINFPASSAYTIHSNTQLASLSAWDMLETLLNPSGYSPFVDAHGVLKTISRDISRTADVVLTEDRLVSVTGSRAGSQVTAVRINWLDPALTYVAQQDQVLGDATITAGFFQLVQHQDIYFSGDASQRAANTYMVIKQSANSGLLPVCSETYEQKTQTSGLITLETQFWVPTLATADLAYLIFLSRVPDGLFGIAVGTPVAVIDPNPVTTHTTPVGRVQQMIAQAALLLIMMSIGTGQYEIRGTPYDYVHARNISEAYDCDAVNWVENVVEIENDFVMNESAAQAYAVRELMYQARSAQKFTVSIVDDPRIEPGDIVQLPDGSRIYVTSYTRDLSRGAPAVLDLEGFRA